MPSIIAARSTWGGRHNICGTVHTCTIYGQRAECYVDMSDSEDFAVGVLDYSSDDGENDAEEHGYAAAASLATAWNDAGSSDSEADNIDAQESIDVPGKPVEVVCQSAVDSAYRVLRYDASCLSVGAFRELTASTCHPIILTGLAPHLAPRGLDLKRVKALLPDGLAVPVRGRKGRWNSDRFFEGLEAGEDLYLADAPIARLCPWLLKEVKCPAYFLHCFTHRTRRQLPLIYETPALFIGAAGTRSSLHIDQMASNFWMFVTHGTKRWTTFHPDDAPLLSPTFDETEQLPNFRPLAELAADPETSGGLARARRLDFDLHAGEVLYIPHGTPHEVSNSSVTVAVSANYVDQTNIEATLRQSGEKVKRLEPGSAREANVRAILDALGEIQWPTVASEDLLGVTGADDAQCQPAARLVGRFPAHERVMRIKPAFIPNPHLGGAGGA